jgi:hypothetical protein
LIYSTLHFDRIFLPSYSSRIKFGMACQKGLGVTVKLPKIAHKCKKHLLFIVICYSFAACAHATGGAVVAWGYNGDGETNVSAGLTNVIAVSAGGYHAMALNGNGTVADWGMEISPVPLGLTNIVAIAAGFDPNSLALRNDGTLVTWGGNDYGVSSPPLGLNNVVAIAAGYVHSLALRNDGTVVAWGDNSSGQTNVPAGLNNVVAISAGEFQSLALRNDGTIIGWGDNSVGESVAPAGLTNAVAVAAGINYFSLGLRSDGTVVGWGQNVAGDTTPPAGLSNVVAIAAGNYYGLALKNDGTVVGWGSDPYGGLNIPTGLTNVFGISAGGDLSLAIVGDGSPHIVRQPFGQTLYSGLSAVLSVGAAGQLPLYYQWQFHGTNISGATNSILTVSGAQVADSGAYSVLVTNSLGAAGSSSALLNVTNVAPIITVQPTNQIGVLGLNTTFAVAAAGSVPLGYQWQFNSNNIAGATNSALTLTNLQATNQGSYGVVVSNAYGTAASSNVLLTAVPFLITSFPTNLTVSAGVNVTFQLSLSAAPPVAYQWSSNFVAIPGATNASLTLVDVQPSNSGTYLVFFTNGYGSTNFNANLTVTNAGPTITSAPISQTTFVGGFGNFHVAARGSEPFTYQWQFNTTNIPGATLGTLVVTNTQLTNQGNYRVVVSNAYNQATSASAVLSVSSLDMGQALNTSNLSWTASGQTSWFPETNITEDGVAAAQSGPSNSVLQTSVTGPGSLTFWWRNSGFGSLVFSVDGLRQSGTVQSTWAQSGPYYIGSGTHQLTWSFSNPFPSFSASGWLDQVVFTSGTFVPVITASPVSKTVIVGTNVVFSVSASGTPPLLYQWQYNSNNLSGATNAQLVLNAVQSTNSGNYSLIVSNDYGVAVSSNAVLVVRGPYFDSTPGSIGLTVQGFEFQLDGLTGHGPVIIYASSNLLNWQPVFTNPPVNGSLQYLDSNATDAPYQFYRAIEQ